MALTTPNDSLEECPTCGADADENLRFIGGDPGHDFYKCNQCNETASLVV